MQRTNSAKNAWFGIVLFEGQSLVHPSPTPININKTRSRTFLFDHVQANSSPRCSDCLCGCFRSPNFWSSRRKHVSRFPCPSSSLTSQNLCYLTWCWNPLSFQSPAFASLSTSTTRLPNGPRPSVPESPVLLISTAPQQFTRSTLSKSLLNTRYPMNLLPHCPSQRNRQLIVIQC